LTKGIHWHVVSDVEFSAADARSQDIDLIRITDPDGSTREYIAMNEVGNASSVGTDIDRILATDRSVRMDCIDCHNRAGHNVPTVSDALDQAMSLGEIDPSLPSVKAQAMTILARNYADDAAADAAIDTLAHLYRSTHPDVAATKGAAISSAIAKIKEIYRLVATPEMKVGARTYVNNLGHTEYPGCFRCHDGGHYKVVAGRLTAESIPSGCATCHTFPQIGSNTSAILIGQRPASHLDRLWIFGHKTVVTTLDPSSTECGARPPEPTANCHATPAGQVPDEWSSTTPRSSAASGPAAARCATSRRTAPNAMPRRSCRRSACRPRAPPACLLPAGPPCCRRDPRPEPAPRPRLRPGAVPKTYRWMDGFPRCGR
jgi:hypothetical protein